MSNLIEYIQKAPEDIMGAEELSQVFINFYLYFKKLHEKQLISNNTVYFLDTALDFSEPIFENSYQNEEYLTSKQFQIEQFLIGLEEAYDKFVKNFKRTFNIPSSYTYKDVCRLIEQSYISYAALRYQQNLKNTRVYQEIFPISKQFYKMPKYIPEINANISEFLDIVMGIKNLSMDGKTYEWFNVFSDNLNIRVIVDVSDGQIVALFINGEEYTDVPSSFIKQIKKHIQSGTQLPKEMTTTSQNNKHQKK